jgi:hypothetical protein
MTILAAHFRLFLVNSVVVIDRLVLGRMQKLWENNPTYKQCTSEANDKKDPTQQTRIMSLVFFGHGTPQYFGVLVQGMKGEILKRNLTFPTAPVAEER